MNWANLNYPVSRAGSILTWSQSEIGRLADLAIDTAVQVGIALDDDHQGDYLREIGDRGAEVDFNNRRVKFSHQAILETLRIMKEPPMPPQTACPDRPGGGRKNRRIPRVGNGANQIFDFAGWEARSPLSSDLVAVCHWAQGCSDVASLYPPFLIKDVNQSLAPLYAYALTAKYCRKIFDHEQPTSPLHVKYLERMSRIVEKQTGHYCPMADAEYVSPPFRMARRAIATMLARIDLGACQMMRVGSMTVSGMTAPVTITGLATSAIAEVLVAATLFRLLRPGFRIGAVFACGSLNMRTGGVDFFGMHTHLGNLAAWEIFTRGLGCQASCNSWYRDANEPGLQACYEFGMSQALFTSLLGRSHPEIGGLANGAIFSPEQALLDMEMFLEFNELTSGFDCDISTAGHEAILEGGSSTTYHMASEHTVNHLADNLSVSHFFFQGLTAAAHHQKGFSQTAELMARAAAEVEAAKAAGAKVEPNHELSRELFACVREASLETGLECPELI